jgi:ABC-type Fe3+-hydroxamate transport system substrate-binding protein
MGRLFSVICALLLLTGCAEEKKTAEAVRICSLSTAASAVLCKLGVPPAAVDQYSAELAPGVPVIGKGTAVSPEKMVELKIDTLVVWSYQQSAVEHFKRHGIRIVALEPVRKANFAAMVKRLGALTKKEEKALQIAEHYEKIFPGPGAGSSKPKRVYLELYTRNRGAGENSYAGELITAAGGKSILQRTALAGTEHIISMNPEVIFFVEGFTTAEEIASRNGFAALDAVKKKKLFPVPRRLLVEGAFPLEAVAYFKKRMN